MIEKKPHKKVIKYCEMNEKRATIKTYKIQLKEGQREICCCKYLY